MRSAEAFHRTLGADTGRVYMHPTSHAIYTRDMDTVTGLSFPLASATHVDDDNYNLVTLGEVTTRVETRGDTKVPERSARPDDAVLTNPLRGTCELSGVEHGAMANAPGVFQYLKQVIPTLI